MTHTEAAALIWSALHDMDADPWKHPLLREIEMLDAERKPE